MKLIRWLWVGAFLLLAHQGCSKDPDEVKGVGSYSPIITGIAIDNEPALRGVPNQLTVQVTNVNGLPVTVHWSGAWGTWSDSTGPDATWVPPDSIGTYDVTVSIEATDPAENNKYYFKTQTFHVLVENEFVRWTRSDGIQFDPAPIGQGGLLFAQIRNNATGESDIWRIGAPMTGAEKVVSDFRVASSPSPRADNAEIIFAGRKSSNSGSAIDDSVGIWLVDWAGGDATTARLVAGFRPDQTMLEHPRFTPEGTQALYVSDTTFTTFPRVWRRDTSNFNLPPAPMLSSSLFFLATFFSPNWGPDVNDDGFPDSIITRGFYASGPGAQSRGLFKFGYTTLDPAPEEVLALSDSTAEAPDWSQDGQYLVYARRNPGSTERDIWIIRADTNDPANAIRVTTGPADDSHPRFSADGMTIYFVSDRADRYGLNGIYPTERRGTNLWAVRLFDRP